MAFQQEVDVALTRHAGCDGRGIIRADKLRPGYQIEEPERLRFGADFPLVANQHRNGDPELQRAVGRRQRNLVVSRDYRNALGTERLSATAEFSEVRYFLLLITAVLEPWPIVSRASFPLQ